jgi:hypothetical protein
VSNGRETVAAVCQVAGIAAAALLVPCYLIDVALDTDMVTILMQGMLAAFACALIVGAWSGQEE